MNLRQQISQGIQILAPSKPHPNQAHHLDQNTNGNDSIRKIIMCKETDLRPNSTYKYIEVSIYGFSFSTFLDVLTLTTSKKVQIYIIYAMRINPKGE